MSDLKWTTEQTAAFTETADNLLVSAAAGSGKTAVLVERIIRLVSDPEKPLDIDRLLVLTFTNAAAGEMRHRVGERLAAMLRKKPADRNLQRQLALLGLAAITTLHSFCLEILRQHFQQLDLDPGFRVADDSETKLLQADVLEAVFEENYEEMNTGFLDLVDKYGGERSDNRLQEIVQSLFEFSRSQPRPEQWLTAAGTVQHYPAIDDYPWAPFLREEIFRQLAGMISQLEKARAVAGRPGGPAGYAPVLDSDLDQLRSLAAQEDKDWEHLYRGFQDLSWGKLSRCGKDVDDTLKGMVTRERNGVKKVAAKIKSRYFSRTAAEHLADLAKMSGDMANLTALTVQFSLAFQKAKTDRGLVDFADLEHYALRILSNTEVGVAEGLEKRFTQILVDEYQDINQVQETILAQVSGNRNRFMVGDVKQSIYRFRQAEPGLFLKKYHDFIPGQGAADRKINLARNFRSCQEIIDGVNFVFKQLMTPVLGEIGYDREAELVCGRSTPPLESTDSSPAMEIHLIDRDGSAGRELVDENGEAEELENNGENGEILGGEKSDDEEELTAAQGEARLVARRIHQMISGAEPQLVLDGGKYRPATYRDMVILLRAAKGWADTFSEELQMAGIPVYADLGSGYFGATEVENMLSLLKIIDNPRQDIFLAGVLRSPLAGFSLEELAILRVNAGPGDLFQALQECSNSEEYLASRVRFFLAHLASWRSKARRGRLTDLIWDIYRETNYYSFVGALPGGSQRQANLRALYDRARQYEATSFRGLFRFLRFIARLQSGGSDLGTARALGENENVVRIISVHKSKGLEFPVVFLPGLGKRFNFQDLHSDILMHRDLGLGANLVDLQTRVVYPTISKLAIRYRLEMESLAEEMRIFYVAMTRAKEKLVMIGSGRNLSRLTNQWADSLNSADWFLADFRLALDRTWLAWLGRSLIRHRDSQVLRALAGCGEERTAEFNQSIWDYPCRWQTSFWPGQELLPLEKEGEEILNYYEFLAKIKNGEPVDSSGQWTEEVRRRLTWAYPDSRYIGKAAKVSVTGLAETRPEEVSPLEILASSQTAANRPEFMKESHGLNAAERGTALHLVMQHLDFQTIRGEADIRGQIERMVDEDVLTGQQAETVFIPAISYFLAGSLGQRLCQAEDLRRETPFTLALPVGEVYPELAGAPEKVLIQGVIDLMFCEDNQWVIVDYKTGHVGMTDEKLKAKFALQLNYYARAVVSIWSAPVKEKYVYLFSDKRLLRIE